MRARVSQLQALEDENFDAFGGEVYAKGFLKSYATELGLDPEPLLETYRSELGQDDVAATTLVGGPSKPPKQRVKPPAWIAWVLVVVVIVAGVAIVGLLDRSGRTPEVANPDQPSTPPPSPVENDEEPDGDGQDGDDQGQDSGSESDETSDTATSDDDEAEDEPQDEEDDRVDVVLALEEDSWMRVIVDGAVALEAVADEGETLQYDGEQEIQIRLGNAGGVRVELNGDDLGTQGGRGEVVEVLLTPDGAEEL